MTYFGNRQNQTSVSDEELEPIFASIADSFNLKWLKTAGVNPLQLVWNRRDALSTNELFNFGDALQRVKAIDAKWVKDQIKHIKSDHPNNRNGAIFEINAVGLLATSEYSVEPAKGNNPGFDAILKLDNKKTMRISLKNYGDSVHFQTFNANCKKVEVKLKDVLKAKGIQAVNVLIEAVKGSTERSHWSDLLLHLPKVFDGYQQGEKKVFAIMDFWAVIITPLVDDYQECHSVFNSYTLIIVEGHNKNESKNLLDKLDQAAANLVKHSKVESEDVINIVFVHLPESASIIECKEWAQTYFSNFPEKPITGVILYQPVIATDPDRDINFIHHSVQFVFVDEKFSKWNHEGKDFTFTLPVGIANSSPSENTIIVENDGEQEKYPYKNKYFFQRGNLYLEGKKDAEGNITGNIKRIASGVFAHSVFQPFPNEPAFVISGRFAPVDKLLIL